MIDAKKLDAMERSWKLLAFDQPDGAAESLEIIRLARKGLEHEKECEVGGVIDGIKVVVGREQYAALKEILGEEALPKHEGDA